MCDWNQKCFCFVYKNLKSSFLHDSHIWLWGFFTFLVSLAHGPPLLLPDCPTTFISFLHFLWSYGGNSVAFTTLAILYFMYCTAWPYLNGKIWKLSTHVYVFLRTERRNKYCKFEYFKIIQCKVLDHTLKQILYYCYTANCTNEKN